MKILIWVASARTGSINLQVGKRILGELEKTGVAVSMRSLADDRFPLYDGDLEKTEGVPAAVETLAGHMRAADALIVVTPEYNGSIPAPLKNAIDWLSRLKEVPLDDKQVLLVSGSAGAFGGLRGLWQTRVPFEVVGAHVFPTMIAIPKANVEVASTDPESLTWKRILGTVGEFVDFAGRVGK